MIKDNKPFLSIKDLREQAGIRPEVDDFISKPHPCENETFFLPTPEVPGSVLAPEDRQKAEALLAQCTDEIGLFGNKDGGNRNSPKYRKAAKEFKKITGIDPGDIIDEAANRLSSKFESRNYPS